MEERTYLCIDMKTFYASCECAERGLNPFETNLVVADETRGTNALCLAITPKLKAQGIQNRCRMSEIPRAIHYMVAPPRMQLYIEYAADIYGLYLRYFSKDDIHVYSIDECFIDVTAYLKPMHKTPEELASFLMNLIATELHIPSTAGIGTNLYLAKIALDITAKHAKNHMGYLNEDLFKETLWNHRPLTDFWGIAKGTATRLAKYGIFDMEAIARAPEELLYRVFGKNAELLIDHAHGRESCLMEDIKKYKSKSKSISFSQILPRDYSYEEARIVILEMVQNGCRELFKQKVICNKVGVFIGYTREEVEPSGGSSRTGLATALPSILEPLVLKLFDSEASRLHAIRRLGISFEGVCDESCEGYDLFTDFEQVEREKAKEQAIVDITERFGKNALLKGTSYLGSATQRERNTFIGGHRAGYDDPRGTSETICPLRCDEGPSGGTSDTGRAPSTGRKTGT